MKTIYNPLTHSYETPDGTTVPAEICESDNPSDAFLAATIREQQRHEIKAAHGTQQIEQERWTAYMDSDERVNCYDSESEACGERECEIDNEYGPGTEVEYLFAPMISAKELLRRRNAHWIGERIYEDIECELVEDMGAEDEVLSLDKNDYIDLGNLVIEFLCNRGKTMWWTVDYKRIQKRTYVAGSNDEAAHGIKEG